jgi:signal transduction histidine kinase
VKTYLHSIKSNYATTPIIEAHGGEIWAKNNDEQKKPGATFSFTLPLAAT